MARSDSVVQTRIIEDEQGNPVALGVTVKGFEELVVDPAELDGTVQIRATLHGLNQKLVDAAALGAGSTPKEKHSAIMEVYNRLTDPDDPQWNSRGEGDGFGGAGLLVRAVTEWLVTEGGYEEEAEAREVARAQIKGWDKAFQAQMRTSDPSIAPIVARLREEDIARRVAKGKTDPARPDTQTLLAGMMKKAA